MCSPLCSYMCALACALMCVLSCPFFCVSFYVCSHMCAFIFVLSSVCSHMSALICVLPYVCSDTSALMCSQMSAPMCSHLYGIIIIVTTTSLISVCPPTLSGVSCRDIFLLEKHMYRTDLLASFLCHQPTQQRGSDHHASLTLGPLEADHSVLRLLQISQQHIESQLDRIRHERELWKEVLSGRVFCGRKVCDTVLCGFGK